MGDYRKGYNWGDQSAQGQLEFNGAMEENSKKRSKDIEGKVN